MKGNAVKSFSLDLVQVDEAGVSLLVVLQVWCISEQETSAWRHEERDEQTHDRMFMRPMRDGIYRLENESTSKELSTL
jgi:hypothetical protein